MKNIYQSKFRTRQQRLKRRSGQILKDIFKVLLVLTSIFTVTSLVIYGYCSLLSASYFGVRETSVRGCKELTEKDILNLASIRPSQNILAVNAEAITDKVKKNPWVKDVQVGREFPKRLVIEVQERTAVALLKKDNSFYLLDLDGVAFKKLENSDESDLPALTGCYREGQLNTHLLSKSLELLRYLSASKEFPNIRSIAEIHADEVLGFSLFTDNNLCLRLGYDYYENKIKRLMPVMADLERRNVPLKYLLIDLSDPAKITVQKRDILPPAGPGRRAKGYRT
jgi:cell division protein FtsQ